MLFNTIEFAIFLPIVFMLFWFAGKNSNRIQNTILLLASYLFYGWWDWRFLLLIIFSSLLDYTIGIRLSRTENSVHRKMLLLSSIVINLGFLGFFKYYNFFAENFARVFTLFGHSFQVERLNILLPVGISFYTFQTLSYSIDVYKRKLNPTTDLISFFAYVSFFPQLVAGPIERATHLLPQFYKQRPFNYVQSVNGMQQILWGLVKKVVIADNCARIANHIFGNYSDLNGSTLVLGAFFFAFQIYGDFSGYSDIAIGTARLFSIDLKQNFNFPYFSRDIAEFWRRWHISLNSWFRDYVYIPLGGSRQGKAAAIRNVFIVFLLSGLWHGAKWTFIVWGIINALYFIPLLLFDKNRNHLNTVSPDSNLPSITEILQMGFTFAMTLLAWIFFRSESVLDAVNYIAMIFSPSLFEFPMQLGGMHALYTTLSVALFLLVEWLGRHDSYAIETILHKFPKPMRYAGYYAIIVFIFWFSGDVQQFIYFQF